MKNQKKPHSIKERKENDMDVDALTDSMNQLKLPQKISFGKKKPTSWTMRQAQQAHYSVMPKSTT
jgi:hypothetical protein